MTNRRETIVFALALALILGLLFRDSLVGGKILSSADILFVGASFEDVKGPDYQPCNRLLIDPVLQFQPWLAFNREAIRAGRLPLWNDFAGCGTPHLANAQSAPFDPFHAIAYLGSLPDAYAWMAFARLWVAGFGMYQLARFGGLGVWGRFFSGLTFPLSGFMILWLAFPVTSVAVWLPWLFLTTGRALETATLRNSGQLALVVGCTLLGGHIQTGAHALLAVGLYGVWTLAKTAASKRFASLKTGVLGLTLGLGIGAITIVPLAEYLGKSPVWNARRVEFRSALRFDRPRLLDAVCTAVPYVYGSQRREHPNLAKALGVHNLNESAGGFAGLATLIWLTPLAWSARRNVAVVSFLGPLTAFGGLAAFGVSPFSNVMRLLPVLDVTDHRRLTLWVAFGLSMLGGIGLDHLESPRPAQWRKAWLALIASAAMVCLGFAVIVSQSGGLLREKAIKHYKSAYDRTQEPRLADYRGRADEQVSATLAFVPQQFATTAAELVAIAFLASIVSAREDSNRIIRAAVLGLTLMELYGFGRNLNPAIDRADDLPETALIRYLKAEVGDRGRILGIGEELVPNTLMRYGLSDIRNYDSVELSKSLDAFPSLFQPDRRGVTSRSTITWKNVIASRSALENAGVLAVVSATAPPLEFKGRVDKVGSVWVARLGGRPLIEAASGRAVIKEAKFLDPAYVVVESTEDETIHILKTIDQGMAASLDGKPLPILPHEGRFIKVNIPAGNHKLILTFRPATVAWSLPASLASLMISLSCIAFRAIFLTNWLGRLGAVRVESIL